MIKRHPKPAYRVAAVLETVEVRRLLSTLVVNTLAEGDDVIILALSDIMFLSSPSVQRAHTRHAPLEFGLQPIHGPLGELAHDSHHDERV